MRISDWSSDVCSSDLLTTSAFASQCTDPEDLSTCSAVSVPGVDLGLPLVNAAAAVRVIQRQVSARGPVGTAARTNQAQVDVSLQTGSAGVGECEAVPLGLNCLLGGLAVGAVDVSVTVDASVRLVEGFGELDAIPCAETLGLELPTRPGPQTT